MMLWEPKIFFWARAVIQEQGSCAIEGRASTHEQFVMTQWSPAFMMPETTAIVAAMPMTEPCMRHGIRWDKGTQREIGSVKV
eukprot:scaffold169104_cov30-Tisochrysis_lutea.AAC.3